MAGERINNIWDMIFDRQDDYQPTMQQEIDYANYMANQPNAQPTQAPVMATQPVVDRQVVEQPVPQQMSNDIPTTVANTQGSVVDANIPQPETPTPPPSPVEEPSFMDKASDFFGDEERMARMTIALNSMRLNPDPNIAKSMELKLDRLHKNKGRNATVIKLREKGRNDLADAVESGAMKATDAWTLAFKDDKDTATITNLKWRATQAGLKEGTEEYRNFMLNAGGNKGMSLTVDKDGNISFSQGGGNGTDKALTEGQSNATMFYGRMQNANKLLDGFEGQGTVLGNALLNKVPLLGNYLISDEGQQYEQAKTNFLTALLRKESGAKIGEEEVELGDSQYFPQPGDSPEVVAQKKINRTNVVKYMRIVAASGADKLDETTKQPTTQPTTQDTSNMPTASTVQQLDALNKGDKYKDSMGNVRTKTWD